MESGFATRRDFAGEYGIGLRIVKEPGRKRIIVVF